jgi:hypothetical protein
MSEMIRGGASSGTVCTVHDTVGAGWFGSLLLDCCCGKPVLQ